MYATTNIDNNIGLNLYGLDTFISLYSAILSNVESAQRLLQSWILMVSIVIHFQFVMCTA